MISWRFNTETLGQYRVSLENVELQSEIATIMAEFGYDSATIGQGKTLLAATHQAFDSNKTEDDETSAAYKDFTTKKEQLTATYSLHHKKAKVIYRNDSIILDKLAISGSLPQSYIKWLETSKKFYSVTIADPAFGKLDDWMSEFYAVAKIALEDNPQLLESLGKLVRS